MLNLWLKNLFEVIHYTKNYCKFNLYYKVKFTRIFLHSVLLSNNSSNSNLAYYFIINIFSKFHSCIFVSVLRMLLKVFCLNTPKIVATNTSYFLQCNNNTSLLFCLLMIKRNILKLTSVFFCWMPRLRNFNSKLIECISFFLWSIAENKNILHFFIAFSS